MQIYFHSCLCSYLPRVPILVEDTVCNGCPLALLQAGLEPSSPSLQNKDPGGGFGSTSRGLEMVGLGVEMGRFRGGDGWV